MQADRLGGSEVIALKAIPLLLALYGLTRWYWWCKRQDVERLHGEIEAGHVKVRERW